MKQNAAGNGMTLIVKTVARLTAGIILLLGIYVIFEGHSSPGGGFAGGVIIALAFIHLNLAFGRETLKQRLCGPMPLLAERLGAPRIMAAAMMGFMGALMARNLFAARGYSIRQFDEPIMSLCHVFIGLNVGAGLFLIFSALVGFRPNRGIGK